MTFRQRILLDRLVATPLSVACNFLVRLLGRVLDRDHSTAPQHTREVVVAKLVGMGSVLQATPLLRALKATYPQARLTFLTLKGNRGLLERLDGVDEVLCLDDSAALPMLQSTARALAALAARRVDHYFDLEVYSGFACLLSIFSLARNRLGFYRHSNRFKRGTYTHLVYFNTRVPVRRLYLQLGRVAGVGKDAPDQLGTIRVTPEDRASLREKLTRFGHPDGAPYLLVNPNASDLLIERRWPAAFMAEALARLAASGRRIVTMGAPSEAEYVAGICARVAPESRARIVDTAGRLTLGEVFALIQSAACVLTNDTGPMHMAFAFQRPTVCLVGPADPVHYSLEQPGVVTLYAAVPCSPCVNEVDEPPCHGNNVCMQRLTPDFVVGTVERVLRGEEKSGTVRLPMTWDDAAGQPLGIVVRSTVPR
jgi:ADP-heptose:LPS heptosyltransferase